MLSKTEVKYIQSLCHKRQRDADGVFIAEGPKLAAELVAAQFGIQHIYAVKEWINSQRDITANVTEVIHADLFRISQLSTPNQVLVIAKQKIHGADPYLPGNITLVLDGIQDPGNMGTILRIADWFGIKQMVCSYDTVDIYNPKVIQSTMGSICRVDCWYKSLEEWLGKVHVPIYGAMLHGQSIYEMGCLPEGLLVIGNESKGIRDTIAQFIMHPITIPKTGEAESLNAAVATGIILSHLIAR